MLTYTGEPGKFSVNGRPMQPGSVITDPQEIKDLTGNPDFIDNDPPKAAKPKAPKKVSE